MSEEIKKRGRNSPTVGDNGLEVESGDIASFIASATQLRRLPPIQTDEELVERCDLYFDWCSKNDMRPGIEGLAFACGVDRRTLWDWEIKKSWTGSQRSEIVKYAKQQIAMFTEQMALKGRLNPVTAIFLMKNHFGYTDKTEISVNPTTPLGEQLTPEEIAKRIPRDIPYDVDYSESDSITPDEIQKRISKDID